MVGTVTNAKKRKVWYPMNRRNYQRELEQTLKREEGAKTPKRLFLHACCAPCSSYCLEYLSQWFSITVFYYNPNIFPKSEYEHRVRELERLVEELNPKLRYPVTVSVGAYEPERFMETVRGYEDCREGGARCLLCYELRLLEAVKAAAENGFDYIATTLTISPLKSADCLNEIGARLSGEYGVPWLFSDFKKKNGYQRSIELSKKHHLYRQDFCGCVFSKRDREEKSGTKGNPASEEKTVPKETAVL